LSESVKIVTQNRKARHEYHILESWEAGLVLQGTEVKSLRAFKANLKDSYARVQNGEIYLYNFHISPYEMGNIYNHDPTRRRKLLLHKKEIHRLEGRVEERGLTLIPLKVYFKHGKAKVEVGLARGKKLYDKRTDIAKRDAELDAMRELRQRNR
jgi:SsrA-binding protein